MRRHDLDWISLIGGIVFTGIALLYLVVAVTDASIDQRLVWPLVLVALAGLVVLAIVGLVAGIVVLSAVSDANVVAECLALGADEYLTKPVELDELLAAVGEAELGGQLGRAFVNLLERDLAIDAGLATAEQVQVGSVQKQEVRHGLGAGEGVVGRAVYPHLSPNGDRFVRRFGGDRVVFCPIRRFSARFWVARRPTRS